MGTKSKVELGDEEQESMERVLAIYDAVLPQVSGDKAVAASITNTVVFDLHYSMDVEDEDEDDDTSGKG
jgi:hypothetical protein